MIIRGVSCGRYFDAGRCGGPLRRLATQSIKVTDRGIAVAERHLGQLAPEDAANGAMIDRLKRIAAGTLAAEPVDLNFYAHELREFVRYRRIFKDPWWGDGDPGEPGLAYDIWSHAHAATLEEYGIAGRSTVLYHESVHHLIER